MKYAAAPSNVLIWHKETQTEYPSIDFGVRIPVSEMNTYNAEVGHLYEHLLFRINKKYTQEELTNLFIKYNAGFNAYTSDDVIALTFRIDMKFINEIIPLMFDIFDNIKTEDFESDFLKEREIVVEESRMRYNDPSVMSRYSNYLLFKNLYRSVAAIPENINKITSEEIAKLSKYVNTLMKMMTISSTAEDFNLIVNIVRETVMRYDGRILHDTSGDTAYLNEFEMRTEEELNAIFPEHDCSVEGNVYQMKRKNNSEECGCVYRNYLFPIGSKLDRDHLNKVVLQLAPILRYSNELSGFLMREIRTKESLCYYAAISQSSTANQDLEIILRSETSTFDKIERIFEKFNEYAETMLDEYTPEIHDLMIRTGRKIMSIRFEDAESVSFRGIKELCDSVTLYRRELEPTYEETVEAFTKYIKENSNFVDFIYR